MKTIKTCILILALSLIVISCKKDEEFTQVSAFENALHNEVNKYRTSQDLNELALKFIMVKEAQGHAGGLANGSITDENAAADMKERWHTIESKFGVNNISNEAHISYQISPHSSEQGSPEAIVAAWAADSMGQIILEGDYTISGPGATQASDGRTYIMHMLCKFTE